jgi:energy-coupling factor transporter ATP-binding protein EcfA2
MWQRDALRRLAQGAVTGDEIRQLADLAVAEAAGRAGLPSTPLDATHMPASATPGSEVRLLSLSDLRNVNAIADGVDIPFGAAGITVIYGDNASGKSGYVRVLKKLCRARAAGGPVHPNVFQPGGGAISVSAEFSVESQVEHAPWSPGQKPPEALAWVSVYDRECASVYVTGENEVAYRPFGLDLLDGLAEVVDGVRRELERRSREKNRPIVVPPAELQDAPGLAGVWPPRATADPETIIAGASWSTARATELGQVERALAAESPAARAAALQAVRSVHARLHQLLVARAEAVSSASIDALRRAAAEEAQLRDALEVVKDKAFSRSALPGVGSEAWRLLWDAARKYSEETAYPEHAFPHLANGARCVFCEQELGDQASDRLRRFHEFVTSDLATRAGAAGREVQQLRQSHTAIAAASDEDETAAADVAPSASEMADQARAFLASCRARAAAALAAAETGKWTGGPELVRSPAEQLARRIEALQAEIDLLGRASQPAEAEKLRERRLELLGQRWLATQANEIRREIARLREVAVINRALRTCSTNAITAESTRLTERYVTQELANAFERELNKLRATRLPVRIARRGQRGAAYHRIELRDPSIAGVRVQDVVSEGEFGAVALAAFLAEIEQAETPSSIVLDDPVSSFDHLHRRSAARRLVEEADRRQVIVFTHDIVFLKSLEQAAEEKGVPIRILHLGIRGDGVGIPYEGPPWTGQKVSERIGQLQRELARAREAYDAHDSDTYDRLARDWYGRLRETWERAVEEILFAGIVERYRHDIQTLRARDRKIWLIAEEDIATLDAAMSKASGQLRGHDQPGAVNDPAPAPDELADDLRVIDEWVQSFRVRRRG